MNAHIPKVILITGSSGSGKNHIVHSIASELDANLLIFPYHKIWFNQNISIENKISTIFNAAKCKPQVDIQSPPTIIFIDRIEVIGDKIKS